MSETATLVPLTDLMPIFAAIGERNWARFKELEREFASKHGLEVWEDVFNFRLKPALDKESDRWLLVQWCSAGIKSVKVVG
ncbi:hypothetical protein DSM106972_090960 [Dulcicalothrix desertica PCC 7102]|uniref:Uncharacterized protein n=1 Tax=Dulcicalothrix desertica PCC 7102 TaxID=232991 RepID=A0A433UN07_9CYAN|nr:hypothetical protein [Dulcicalothrix desertica]RUS95219.1 hypothetical protein DSM106972_090960 [Dulcicalothrix desertica PCC 7102]